MLEELKNDTGQFRGIRDSCIDEAVYSVKHLMGLAGTNKPDGTWPLHPISIPTNLDDMDEDRPILIDRTEAFSS